MSVRISFLKAGHCTHSGAVVAPGKNWSAIEFPATVAVIEHPKEGLILFDTGYSQRFYSETRRFPNSIYAWITPVFITPEMTAAHQLKSLGYRLKDVRYVILSHFHADHIAGAADFPHARYVYSREGYDRVRKLGGLSAVLAGFLKGLLPADFESRSLPVTSEKLRSARTSLQGFETGYDLFGDESIVLIELPGHAAGQLGAAIRTATGHTYFLVADACWLRESVAANRLPSRIANLAHHDVPTYQNTFRKIHGLYQSAPQDLTIVPCHCSGTMADLPMTLTNEGREVG